MTETKRETGRVTLMEHRDSVKDDELFTPIVRIFFQIAKIMANQTMDSTSLITVDNWEIDSLGTVYFVNRSQPSDGSTNKTTETKLLASMMYTYITQKPYTDPSNLALDLGSILYQQTGFSSEGSSLYHFIEDTLTGADQEELSVATEELKVFDSAIKNKQIDLVRYKTYVDLYEQLFPDHTSTTKINESTDSRILEAEITRIKSEIETHPDFESAQSSYDQLDFLMKSLGKESTARRPNIDLLVSNPDPMGELQKINEACNKTIRKMLPDIVEGYTHNYQLIIDQIETKIATVDPNSDEAANLRIFKRVTEENALAHKHSSTAKCFQNYQIFAKYYGINITDDNGKKSIDFQIPSGDIAMTPEYSSLRNYLAPTYCEKYYYLQSILESRSSDQKQLYSKAANIRAFLPKPNPDVMHVSDLHRYIEAMNACNEVIDAIEKHSKDLTQLKTNLTFLQHIETLVKFPTYIHESKHPKVEKLCKAFLTFAAVALVIVGILAAVPSGGTSLLATILGSSLLTAKSAGAVAGAAALGTGVTATLLGPQNLTQSIATFKSHVEKITGVEAQGNDTKTPKT